MVECLQKRYHEVLVVIACCILFCYGTQDECECHYWYRRFPATPSAVCYGTNQTTTVTLLCEVEYRFPNRSYKIEVNWYRSKDEETAGIEGKILNDVNKYQQSNGNPTPVQVNQTFIRQYLLGILRFNSSDRGYYWCQIVVNDESLSPSPYGHIHRPQCILQNAICDIDQPICAQNSHAQYMALRQVNSCLLVKYNNISTRTTDTANITMSSFPTIEVASAIVAVIVLLTFTIIVVLSIVYVKKHRSESRKHEVIVHHYAKIELDDGKEANDISNPHYTGVRGTNDQSCLPPTYEETTGANDLPERGDSGLSKTEHGSNVSTQQHPHSEAEEVAQINHNHNDQTKSQDSHKIQTETDISSEYAVIDKNKKASRLQSNGSTSTRPGSAMENHQYDKLKQDRPAKVIITSEEGIDQLREKSPSPTYAELSVREKIPKVTKCPTEVKLQQKDCELDSHEYARVDQASAKVTKREPEEVEQHYYYSLENPEESCSDSKGKEDTINTGENDYDMPHSHHLVIYDKSVAPNTDEEAELASLKKISATPLDSHPEEAHTDKANI